MANRPESVRRTLKIVNQTVLATWADKTSGNPVVLYEVTASDSSGAIVEDMPFRSFRELPIGEELEFEVTPFEHAVYGLTYTLKLPPQPLGPRVAKLEERVAELEQGLAKLASATPSLPPGRDPRDPGQESF